MRTEAIYLFSDVLEKMQELVPFCRGPLLVYMCLAGFCSLRADSTVNARSEKEKKALYRELSSPFPSSALTVESARRLGFWVDLRYFFPAYRPSFVNCCPGYESALQRFALGMGKF